MTSLAPWRSFVVQTTFSGAFLDSIKSFHQNFSRHSTMCVGCVFQWDWFCQFWNMKIFTCVCPLQFFPSFFVLMYSYIFSKLLIYSLERQTDSTCWFTPGAGPVLGEADAQSGLPHEWQTLHCWPVHVACQSVRYWEPGLQPRHGDGDAGIQAAC